MKAFVFTCGDINGIGPEIVVKTINKFPPNRNRKIIFICPKNVFESTIQIVKPKFKFYFTKGILSSHNYKDVIILDLGYARQNYGKPAVSSGKTSYRAIIEACRLAKEGIADSIITSPISKHSFVKAKIEFPGHTELLADYFKIKDFAMMFVSNKMRAGLITIHMPISEVSKSISISGINNTLKVISNSLKNDFNISKPRIALLGLNPHAGEEGNIGTEDKKILLPVIRKNKECVSGPFVPDAFFGNGLYREYDCTIGIYHDQILIPFKLMNFNRGVNFTAGLPIIRTSPDHGTAFDISGKGRANPESMMEAFKYAQKISRNRRSIH